ncbi:MAG TPA: mannonate dehydratase [Terriglobia bacterium]|jgi:mannonate dehydratase|nr:mannonate dehydratase [Terriglobia bacterium]
MKTHRRVTLLAFLNVLGVLIFASVPAWGEEPNSATPNGDPTPAQAAGNPTERRMRPAVAITKATDEVLTFASQLGIRDIIVYGGPGSTHLPGSEEPLSKPRASYQDYLALRQRIESHGLRLAGFEGGFVSLPRYRDVFFGGPKRDELVRELTDEIRDMGRAGIPIFGYHWMVASVWRTRPVEIRGGASATAFDYELIRGIKDRATCEQARAAGGWQYAPCEAIPDTQGRAYSEEELWRNLEYWIKHVTPVAESAGIRLGIHPDDPPVAEIAGIPRLLRNHAAYRRLIEIYPSDSNGIEFCQGTFSEMTDDVYDAIRYFGSRRKILYVHFRNVSGKVPRFHEEFINTGYVDMVKAMRIYKEVGYSGVFIDDHCPTLEGDAAFPGNLGGYRSRAFAQGYIQALLDAVKGE